MDSSPAQTYTTDPTPPHTHPQTRWLDRNLQDIKNEEKAVVLFAVYEGKRRVLTSCLCMRILTSLLSPLVSWSNFGTRHGV